MAPAKEHPKITHARNVIADLVGDTEGIPADELARGLDEIWADIQGALEAMREEGLIE
jgi:hypothetical protein